MGLKLNQDYMSEMSKCNTAHPPIIFNHCLLIPAGLLLVRISKSAKRDTPYGMDAHIWNFVFIGCIRATNIAVICACSVTFAHLTHVILI